nr:hypothetical protein [uncultured Pseudomonas sp.]
MEISTYKYFFGEWSWAEREQRASILLCGFTAFVSTATLISAIALYSKQTTASILKADIEYFPHRNEFSSAYSAGRGYATCQVQTSLPLLDQRNCTDDCAGNSAEPLAPADISLSILQCHEDENTLYTEFSQELFHGMGSGLSIEIIKGNWSF